MIRRDSGDGRKSRWKKPCVKSKPNIVRIKVSLKPFQRLAGSRDRVPCRGPQSAKHPGHSKEFLFLLLFLLDKGEKVEKESGYSKFYNI